MASDGGSSMENLFQLHFVDYIVIGLMLLLSMCIGIYQGLCSGGKQKTTHEYLLGNRQLGAFPVGISVFISVISAVTFIGNPAEVYINGPTFWLVSLNGFAVGIIITRTFIPVFYRLKVTSIYEYLELRFNKVVRMSAVIISVISGFIYMSFVIYAPALAISSITNLSLDLSIIVIGAVCTFYSSLGGIKAVIWADVFQAMVMVLGLIVVLITGTVQVGGVGNIIDLLEKGNRDQFFDVGIDPTIRHSVWAIMIGGVFQAVYTSGVNQLVVQRNLSCKSEQGATVSAWIGVIGVSLTRILASACGVVMFAYYVDCDPVDAGRIETRDQIMPLFIVDLFGHIRGLSGLILSAIFSASLSTVSSGVNAVSANISEDFVKPHFKYSEACITLITKLIAAVCGVIATSLAYVAPLFGSNLLEAALGFVGVLSGPLLGVFSLGMFLPHCNSTGAMSGLVSGAVLGYFFLVSSFLLPLPLTDQLGYLNYNCSDVMSNFTMLETTTSYVTTPVLNDDDDLPMWFLKLCNVSYMYYGCFTCLMTIVVGLVVSLLTGPMDPASLNRDLFCPLVDAFFCCLPKTCTKRCCSSVGKNYEAKVAGYVNDAYEVEANGHVSLPTPASELFVNERTSDTRF